MVCEEKNLAILFGFLVFFEIRFYYTHYVDLGNLKFATILLPL